MDMNEFLPTTTAFAPSTLRGLLLQVSETAGFTAQDRFGWFPQDTSDMENFSDLGWTDTQTDAFAADLDRLAHLVAAAQFLLQAAR